METAEIARVAPMNRARVSLLLVVGMLATGVSGVIAAFVIDDAGDGRIALSLAFWRCFGGAVALAPFALRARRTHPLARRDLRLLLIAGVGLSTHFAMYLGSIVFTTVASSTTLATMAGVFVAIGSIRFLDERPDRRTWAGIVLTMVGAIAIGAGDLADIALGPRALFGDLLAFLSSVTVAVYLIVGRAVRSRVHSATFASVVYATAAALLLVTCAAVGAPIVDFTGPQWLGIIGMIVGPQLLGHNIFTTLLSTVPATLIGVVVLAEPLIATLLAWGLLGQLPATTFWLAAPIVLTGLLIATVRRTAPA